MRALPTAFLVVLGFIVVVEPAGARITRTRPSPTKTWSPLTPITIGGGFEYESNDEARQYDFPWLFEYNFSERFRLTAEPDYTKIDSRDEAVLPSASGLGDLETSLEYEFLRERRYRPALTAESIIRWPTASSSGVGEPGTDYGIGLVASKDFVYFDLDLDVRYVFAGSSDAQDATEIALAGEYPVNHYFDLIAEVVQLIPTGNAGPDGGGGNEFEATLGFAWHVTRFLKIEQGFVRKDDGTNQVVVAWEYSFAGED